MKINVHNHVKGLIGSGVRQNFQQLFLFFIQAKKYISYMYFVLQAVCCSDKLHCCPNGYTCDVAAGRCLKGDEFLALFTKQPSKPQVNDVTCPDESTCPTGQTCCQNQQGGYSCCPLPSVSHLLYFFTLNKLQHVVTKNASHLLQSFCSK